MPTAIVSTKEQMQHTSSYADWMSASRRCVVEPRRPRCAVVNALRQPANMPFQSNPSPPTNTTLHTKTGRSSIPHPEKSDKGGEDAHIVVTGAGCTMTAVLDGVGGWSRVGVDSGLYSKTLARKIAIEFAMWSSAQVLKPENALLEETKPLLKILQRAYAHMQNSKVLGSCTVCMSLLFPNGKLHVLNVGDSGLRVVRKNKIIFATQEQQRAFNFPRQLGTASKDAPSDGDYSVIDVEVGDSIVTASDGVWDNLWEHEFLALLGCIGCTVVGSSPEVEEAPDLIARRVAEAAHRRGSDASFFSPFSAHARQAGLPPTACIGGKLDDTTILVSRVC